MKDQYDDRGTVGLPGAVGLPGIVGPAGITISTLAKGYEITTLNNNKIYRIHNLKIIDWVEGHPKHLYKKEDNTALPSFIFSPEMESWFLLRWS